MARSMASVRRNPSPGGIPRQVRRESTILLRYLKLSPYVVTVDPGRDAGGLTARCVPAVLGRAWTRGALLCGDGQARRSSGLS